MIKKYFAISMVTASVLAAGCSSDDNDDDVVDPGDTPPIVVVATPGVGGTGFDTIANSDVHNTAQAAIEAAGLADTLDDPANTFTIFAPTDAAFEALDNDGDDATPTTAELLNDVPALTRVLQYHVLVGDIDDVTLATLVTDAGDQPAVINTNLVDGETVQTVEFTNDATLGLSINGVAIAGESIVSAEEAASGRVYSINSVLIPPAAPEVEEPVIVVPDPDPGSGEDGPILTSMLNDADGFSTVLAVLGSNTIKIDEVDDAEAPWNIFAPTDAALAGADVVLGDLVFVGDRKSALDLIADGSVTTFDGSKTYAIGGTDAASLTIGGAPATELGGGTSITYKLDAVPVSN